MCSVCWDILYKVIKFLPVVRDRNALKPDFVSATDWQVWREFFSRNRNRLFWKGISSKPRYRVSQQSEEATIFYLEYTSDGVLIPKQPLEVVSREKALDILRGIHCSSDGGCKVVGLNSLVSSFHLDSRVMA